ncbi:hypothetical protein J1N35_028738 [Gossypium stocksii]|uniref:Uncharacterized protein n=1 Tax=Gossypium stocksii TaxID=47602 RepID=A0A9D3UWH6_9ROSI|nr:hypothetical protein J1N35_028738 [Gossypium stocksii]
MTRGTETLILKKAGTSKTKKGKAKADSKGTTLYTVTSLWRKMKDVEKMDTVVENEIDAAEEEVVVEVKVIAEEEKVARNENEKAEENFVEKVVTALGSVGTNIDNLEQTGVRPTEVAKVTSEGQCNS